MHHFIHNLIIIQQKRPLTDYWCMRYEAKQK